MDRYFDEHGQWWNRRHAGEDPALPGIGLYKALRNVAHHWLKSQQSSEIGVDWNAPVSEALGDCVMYLFSVCRTSSLPRPQKKYDSRVRTSRNFNFANLLADAGAMFSVVALQSAVRTVSIVAVENALTSVLAMCDCCCVDFDTAVRTSLEKLSRK